MDEREVGRRDPSHAAGLAERSRPDPRELLAGRGADGVIGFSRRE
jgi:hypothetical protein